jgi:hypothetical protein
VIFILLFSSLLTAKETCYSVELLSVPISSDLSNVSFDDECKKFKIGQYISVRCGCEDSIKNAKVKLKKFKRKFKKAYITTTYKERFLKDNSLKNKKINKTKQIKKIKTSNKIQEYIIKGYDFLDIQEQEFESKNSIKTIIKKLHKDRKRQVEFLENTSKFYGLSLDAKYDQYFNQHYRGREYTDFEYNVKLKYDLFKNGYFGYKKRLENEKNIINENFYKDIINLERYSLKETLQNIDSLSPLIDFNYYASLHSLTQEMILKQLNLNDFGIVATYEIELLKKDLQRYEKFMDIYAKSSKITLSAEIYTLLKNIQTLKLIDKDILKKYAKEHNSEVLLQASKLQMLENTKTYLDESVVDMYASNRTMDEIGRYNTIGIEAILPLNLSTFEHEELKKLQRGSILSYKKALYGYIDNSIDSLYDEFFQTQYSMQNNNLKFDILNEKLQKYKLIEENNIASLHIDILQKIYLLKQDMLKLKLETSKSKIMLLKIIVKLAYITNKYDIDFTTKR